MVQEGEIEVPLPPPPPPPPPSQPPAGPHQSELGGYTSIPEEMGFHVSIDTHDEQNGNFEGSTKWEASTGGYSFNYDAMETRDMRDEAMGYLSGATYMRDTGPSQKKDHSTTDSALYGNSSMLVTAIQYEEMDGIKGEIIDEIDYENVTIVRTTGNTSGCLAIGEDFQARGNHAHSPGNESDLDYLSVESFDTKSLDSPLAGAHQSVHHASTLASGPVHPPDVVCLNSAKLPYEYYDPPQRASEFETSLYANGMDEYAYELNHLQPYYEDTVVVEQRRAVTENDDLYMNVGDSGMLAQGFAESDMSHSSMVPADEDENYENTMPMMYEDMR